jgi:hypothetical protein
MVRAETERKARAENPFFSRESIASVNGKAVIESVHVVTRGRSNYFFYRLRDAALLWPHAALEISARCVTVTVRKSTKPRPLAWRVRSEGRNEQSKPTRPFFAIPDANDAGLYIGGLPYDMNDVGLLRLFTPFGDVEGVDIVRTL